MNHVVTDARWRLRDEISQCRESPSLTFFVVSLSEGNPYILLVQLTFLVSHIFTNLQGIKLRIFTKFGVINYIWRVFRGVYMKNCWFLSHLLTDSADVTKYDVQYWESPSRLFPGFHFPNWNATFCLSRTVINFSYFDRRGVCLLPPG